MCLPVHGAREGKLFYSILDGEVTITDYDDSNIMDLIIPETIEGYPVVAIGNHAFEGAVNLRTVQLPDTVTTIGGSDFPAVHKTCLH